jgi:hypothetical protein
MNTTTKATYKTVKTIKDYPVNKFRGGYSFTIPAGSIVSNKTACGYDDSCRFWVNFREVARKVTGYKNSLLSHDLEYYGVNVPAVYYKGSDYIYDGRAGIFKDRAFAELTAEKIKADLEMENRPIIKEVLLNEHEFRNQKWIIEKMLP